MTLAKALKKGKWVRRTSHEDDVWMCRVAQDLVTMYGRYYKLDLEDVESKDWVVRKEEKVIE